jgi:hypothetical protein
MGRAQWHHQRVATQWHEPAGVLLATLCKLSRRLLELTRGWLTQLRNAKCRREVLLEALSYKNALDAHMAFFPTRPGHTWRCDVWNFWRNRRLPWLIRFQKTFYTWRGTLWERSATRALTPIGLALTRECSLSNKVRAGTPPIVQMGLPKSGVEATLNEH